MIAVAPPQHPLAVVPGLVHAVRQSGAAVGWMSGECYTVQLLRGGRAVTLGRAGTECTAPQQPLFAVAPAAALWISTYSGNETYSDVIVGAPGRRPRRVEEVIGESAIADGQYVTAAAATNGSLVYSVLAETSSDGCYGQGGACVQSVTAKSRVMLLQGTRAVRLAALPPAVDLAAGEGRLAVVVAATAISNDRVAPSGDVDVFTLPGAAPVAAVHVDGAVRAVGVSRAALAVVVASRLERFDGGGRPLGSTTLPTAATSFSVSGTRIVFRVGRTIRVLDARTGRARIVATATRAPLGLSISGDRIVWAERSAGSSRVVALFLRR